MASTRPGNLRYTARMELFLVGGAVRDMIMGRDSKDWDFACVLEGWQDDAWIRSGLTPFGAMGMILKGMGFEIFQESPEHLTIRARAPRGFTFAGITPPVNTFDFVLARRDVETDGRHAIVEPGTLRDDLARRDFTMNAIAINSAGEFIDPFCGRTDIHDRLIRTVGDPAKRFEEDSLRVLRALRFAIVLGFRFADDLLPLVHPDNVTDMVKSERVDTEIRKIWSSVDGWMALWLLRDWLPFLESRGFEIDPPVLRNQ